MNIPVNLYEWLREISADEALELGEEVFDSLQADEQVAFLNAFFAQDIIHYFKNEVYPLLSLHAKETLLEAVKAERTYKIGDRFRIVKRTNSGSNIDYTDKWENDIFDLVSSDDGVQLLWTPETLRAQPWINYEGLSNHSRIRDQNRITQAEFDKISQDGYPTIFKLIT